MHTAAKHTPRPLLNAIVTRAVLLTSSIDGHVAEVSVSSYRCRRVRKIHGGLCRRMSNRSLTDICSLF